MLLIECFFQSKYFMPFLRLLEYSYTSGIVNSYCILIPSCLYLCKLNEVVSSSPKAPSGCPLYLSPSAAKTKDLRPSGLIMTSLFSRCSGGQRSKIKVKVPAGRHSPWRLSGRIPLCLLELLVVAGSPKLVAVSLRSLALCCSPIVSFPLLRTPVTGFSPPPPSVTSSELDDLCRDPVST